MATKYRARMDEIEAVECERETESCVFIEGIRHNKRGDFASYHDTRRGAAIWLVHEANKKASSVQAQADYYHEKAAKLEKEFGSVISETNEQPGASPTVLPLKENS